MRIFLLGLLCVALGTTLGIVGDIMVLGPGVSGQALQGLGGLMVFSAMLGVALAQFVGLCIVAPLLPKVRADGLRTPAGGILVAAMLVVEVLFSLTTVEDFGGRPILAGAAALGIALFVFDRVAVSRRGTQPVTIILIGFACGALPGPITTAVVGFPLFRALFSTLTGVVDSGMGTFIGMDAVAVAAALLIGLCIVAASVPTIATDGLWSRAGAILTAAIVAAELIILCAELFRFSGGADAYLSMHMTPGDWLALAGATALPGLAGTAVGLALFQVFWIAVRPRQAQPRSGMPAAA